MDFTYEKVGFNLKYAASLTLRQFIDANQHQWPNKSEADRNADLRRVHKIALEAYPNPKPQYDPPKGTQILTAAEVAQKQSHDNSSADAPEVGGGQPAGDNGGSDRTDEGGGDTAPTGSTLPEGGEG